MCCVCVCVCVCCVRRGKEGIFQGNNTWKLEGNQDEEEKKEKDKRRNNKEKENPQQVKNKEG